MYQQLDEILPLAASAYSSKIALTSQKTTYTYSELAQQTAEFADAFSALKHTQAIPFLGPKSPETVALLLGALQAKKAYVPLDVSSPKSRIDKIIDQHQFPLFFIHRAFFDDWKSKNPEPFLNDWLCVRTDYYTPSFQLENCAYVLFTSGSTGTPKGVVISHLAACHFINWGVKNFGLASGKNRVSIAPLHFDLSIFDVFVSLAVGATLFFPEEQVLKQPLLLTEYLAQQAIELMYTTPTVLQTIHQFGKFNRYNFQFSTLLFAGEVFPIQAFKALQKDLPKVQFYNLYGPTETNVCTAFRVPANFQENEIPIGEPIGNFQYKISSENNELLIAGDGVFTEYLNQPTLTANRFIHTEKQEFYATGDQVYTVRSQLHYRGRIDKMVKRKGFRIELGEIEKCYESVSEIWQCAAIAASTEKGVKITLHYSANERISVIQLKQKGAHFLPAYMLPDAFVFHTQLPVTSSGKINLQQLENQAHEN